MRSDARALRWMVGLTLSLATALGATACGSGAGLDPGRIPPSMRAQYQRFEARCSRCHSLSRPLSAPVQSVEHWQKYLARMRRMPGSGINSQDAELILEFLTYYTLVIRRGGDQADLPTESGGGESAIPPGEPPPATPADQSVAHALADAAPPMTDIEDTTAAVGSEETHDAP